VTREQLRERVLQSLAAVVPELRPADLDAGVALRDQLDIDSMDFINFVIELDKSLGVAIPEADYGELATLDACVAYLERMLAGSVPPGPDPLNRRE
jgi:acyl carrier protein